MRFLQGLASSQSSALRRGRRKEWNILIKKEIVVRKDFTDGRGTDLMVKFLFKPSNNLMLTL